ncbi:cysteine peptidase family C39 domain-containing protein [Acinetobacter baumannii]|uniref:cysteine peptidase family C39 domain-containing protein n=1 Tax=Acinetobacter baumannii TaxID=470 RepID=UPI001FF48057|nr:cysteine peptidase family C39 domain-containing protein [Acinetobacter baumannii]MCJ9043766.1 hypothetical protein [Acinetobacter baumannii]MCJ9146963.1 hypothetical protein [Acinetobacter baumannii]MCJ9295710.1 hypothetical protein [Acinetobacter baumannii]MCJ9511674.1 hypothetical protein [Acinetobacter baumannii]HAV2807924.1 hypothetical protein [Acinetobacter baumannii]
MTIKRIIQEDSTGCGIACVAMVAGLTYNEAKQIALDNQILKSKKNFYTRSNDVANFLNFLGIKSQNSRKVCHWESIKTLSIVAINYREATDNWHWVVYIPNENKGFVLDPNKKIKNEIRVDFSRMKLRSYIPISLP